MPVFAAKKFHREVAVRMVGGVMKYSYDIFTPSCQYLPGFRIIPKTPPNEWNWQGKWYTIDF